MCSLQIPNLFTESTCQHPSSPRQREQGYNCALSRLCKKRASLNQEEAMETQQDEAVSIILVSIHPSGPARNYSHGLRSRCIFWNDYWFDDDVEVPCSLATLSVWPSQTEDIVCALYILVPRVANSGPRRLLNVLNYPAKWTLWAVWRCESKEGVWGDKKSDFKLIFGWHRYRR